MEVAGTAGDDALWIDFSSITTVNGSGDITQRFGAGLSYSGLAGTDSVTWINRSGLDGTVTIDSESINVASGATVDATGDLLLQAADTLGNPNHQRGFSRGDGNEQCSR